MQPVSQWTSTHVVEWMAALNLYRYAELFRSKDIKGLDLLSLDKDKLTVIIFEIKENMQIIMTNHFSMTTLEPSGAPPL